MAQWTEERRQAQRELALRLHEQGKFGGVQPNSGRPRKRRASEVINEQIELRWREILDALFDALQPDKSPNTRLKAAEALMKIADRENDRTDKETERLENMTATQIIDDLMPDLQRLMEAGVLSLPKVGDVEIVSSEAVVDE